MKCVTAIRGTVLAGLLLAVGGWVSADEIDHWAKPTDPTRATSQGTITDDVLFGVKFMKDDKEGKIPRKAVYGTYYEGSDTQAHRDAEAAFTAGDYSAAEKGFKKVAQSADGMPADRKAMLMQHLYYYAGVCQMKMGHFDQAEGMFLKVLDKKDSVWYFEAELARAACKEGQRSYAEAADAFGLLAKNEFPKYATGPASDVTPKFVYTASQAAIRCGLKNVTRNPGNEGQVNELLQQQDALMGGATAVLEENPDLKVEAFANKARGFKYLKKYKELIDILENPIRSAVEKGDRNALASMYLDRADAYHGLMEAASGAEKKELMEIARFEYMRYDMGNTVGGEDDARAQYRLGKLFSEIKDKDWQIRAMRYLQNAASNKDGGQYARDAGALFKSVSEGK